MKKRVIIDMENFTLLEFKKEGLFSSEVVQDNKTTIPTHTIKLVQKAYDSNGISSLAIFFEVGDDEYFFTQDDLENDLQGLFDEFIEVRNKLLQIQDYINIYRIEEYNIETKETIDR